MAKTTKLEPAEQIANLEICKHKIVNEGRLLYARSLAIHAANGPVDQLAQSLKHFLARCDRNLQGKLRGKILEYFNPVIDHSAQKNIQHQGEDKTAACDNDSTVQKCLNSNNCQHISCDYERQLALLKSQIDKMQRQAPAIGHQLQTFGHKLAMTESALKSQQRKLAFQTVTLRKETLKKNAPDISTSAPSIETTTNEFRKSVISSPLRLSSHFLSHGSSSPKGTTDVGKRAPKPIMIHKMQAETTSNRVPLPIFHSSVPTSLIGVPARTLASISNRHNIHPIWSQSVPGLHKLPSHSVRSKLHPHSPRLLAGTFANLSQTAKTVNPTSPSRTRANNGSLPITVTIAAAKVSPKKTGDLHVKTVELAAATMTRVEPEKRARSESLQGQARRPRIQLTNGRQSQK